MSRVTKLGDYYHVAVQVPSGAVEHWLLTEGEVGRIRGRAERRTLARPRLHPVLRGLYRMRRFFRSLLGG